MLINFPQFQDSHLNLFKILKSVCILKLICTIVFISLIYMYTAIRKNKAMGLQSKIQPEVKLFLNFNLISSV